MTDEAKFTDAAKQSLDLLARSTVPAALLEKTLVRVGRAYQDILRGWLDRIHIATSATGVAARRERGKMPKAASDRVNNEADAPVPPSGWVVYPAVPSVTDAARGLTGLKHIMLGSTAESVVRHAPCPVLTLSSATAK